MTCEKCLHNKVCNIKKELVETGIGIWEELSCSNLVENICRHFKASGQHHYLKILPEYFTAVDEGIKTFEIRFNDRNYQVGDILHLNEFCDGEYTGRETTREVCYIIDNPEYCKEGFVVLGIKDY